MSQDFLNVLIRINQASSHIDIQKNVYHIYKILYFLHVSLNDYKFEDGKFDPENDWKQVFSEEEVVQRVKTKAELKLENTEEETE
jgi:hypothetical protein